MKKIILTTLMLISFAVYAQSDYRDAFMGTWIWHNNTDTFRIKFKKAIFNFRTGDGAVLYGYHEYKSGNKVLESSLKDYDTDTDMKLGTIDVFWRPHWNTPNNIIEGYITDVEYKDYMRDLVLTLSPDKKNMQFEAKDLETLVLIIAGEGDKFPKGRTFFFPKKATFIKEEDMPVVVLPPPTISTQAITNLSFYSATLNGTLNPNGNKNVAVYFDYGTTTAYGKRVEATPALVSGNNAMNVSYNLTGLTANNTTYHYRLVTIANGNIYYGEDKWFSTLYDLPTMSFLFATISTNKEGSSYVKFGGHINPNNMGEAKVYFEYQANGWQRIQATPSTVTGGSQVNVSSPTILASSGSSFSYRMVCIIGGKTYYSNATQVSVPLPDKTNPFK